jgi:molybdopterin converting factor small subunit
VTTSNDRYHSSRRPTGRAALLTAAGVLVLPAVLSGAAGQPATKMKPVERREIVRTVESRYAIYQGDEEVGSETALRNDFNDNSVQFLSESKTELAQGTKTEMKTDLVLEQESFFPMSYEMTKHVVRGDFEYEVHTRIEWFSNVAVAYKTSGGVLDTMRTVLPSGSAVLDMSLAHQLYVPLYWYDLEVGGVQNFNVVDPLTLRQFSATLRLQTGETIVVNGENVETERYEFTRDKQVFKIYVDEGGRIVKLDQGFLVFELAEWSENVLRAE